MIKSLSGKNSVENVKKDIDEIETINIELEHTLKNELRKLKGKHVVDTVNNKDAHEVYIEKATKNTDTLCGFVERVRIQNPSKPLLESTCMFTKHVQELLVYVSQTCPISPKPSEKLVAVTPTNKDKRVRFSKPVTSSSNIAKQTDSLKTKDSNKPLLTSTGVKPTTSVSGSKPSGNTKNNRITRPPSSNHKNKVEDHFRKVKSSLNKMNFVSKPVSNALVKYSVRNAKFKSTCAICRTFTIVRNKCPLTRITSTKVVPTKETSTKSVATQTQGILVYSRRPKATRSVGSSSKVKIVESKTSNSKEPKQSWGSTVSDVLSSSLNNYRLSKFFSGQFCDSDLEFTWVKFLRTKDEVLDFIISLNATVRNIMTDNGTEFVYQTLRDYSEEVKISHQTSVARTPQQNGIVERRNLLAVIAPEPAVSTGTPSSTTIDQDAPSSSTSQTTQETQTLVIPLGVEEADHDIEVEHLDNNPFVEFLIPEPSSEESSTQVVIPNHVHSINQPPEHINKWTKYHPIDNVIGDPSRSVSTRQQLYDEAL
ncbi:retrovirus-related pol polyprotein from transposon TNT 1-94, partial [Tanacetum coccineum]